MESIQKLAIPIAIVIAGALIASALYLASIGRGPSGSSKETATATIELRGLQENDHIRGSADASVVMVEFSDSECPFCKVFDSTAKQVMEKYGGDGKVAWVYRYFPIPSLHPKAPKEAEALECAAELGGNEMFWKYADKVYMNTTSNNSLDIGVYNNPATAPINPATGQPYYAQKTPRSATDAGQLSDFAVELGIEKESFEECLASGRNIPRIETDVAEAGNSGGSGTPYIVFISKEKMPSDARSYLDSLIPTVGANTFVISKDGKRVYMSGALPFNYIDQLIELILD